MKAFEVIKKYDLIKHPEGGYFKETLRLPTNSAISDKTIKRTGPQFSAGTSILYMLEHESKGDFSAWHKLNDMDEIWNYHFGSPIAIYSLDLNGDLTKMKLGSDEGSSLQIYIPKNTWFCAVIEDDDQESFSLVSCTVIPGFEFCKFQLGDRAQLIETFPQHTDLIRRFTRNDSEAMQVISR